MANFVRESSSRWSPASPPSSSSLSWSESDALPSESESSRGRLRELALSNEESESLATEVSRTIEPRGRCERDAR